MWSYNRLKESERSRAKVDREIGFSCDPISEINLGRGRNYRLATAAVVRVMKGEMRRL